MYSFDFAQGYQDWTPGIADYDSTEIERYRFQHGFRERPASTGSGGSLFISSMNRSDDLFMFHQRQFADLAPSAKYLATFRVTVATKYVSQMGIGGDPAMSVHLKGCFSSWEPKHEFREGAVRLNVDIGKQSSAGANSVLMGNIDKPNDGTDQYVLIERVSRQPLTCTTDDRGRIWILFGTDSGYEGLTELYYTRFELSLQPADA
jgi:hypothetical protein